MTIEELRQRVDECFDREEFLSALECSVELISQHAKEVSFDDIFKKGLCHFKLEEDAEAIGCFNRALEKDPDNVMALTNKGICLFNLEKTAEAFHVFNRAIKINPNVFPPWHYMGMYHLRNYIEKGDLSSLEKMVNCYRQVVCMAPDFGEFIIHDPVNKADYPILKFLLLHQDVQELPVDILTSV
ncbi:MAG: tetratricopeptide repeat protein [Dehalococcoidia bacterium]|nr:tetratricopeptide repeat protein [Dehalococcoidia bacterium]MDD5647492.1 tetratricopeptide repeat protein [Dehalococcoidia bacterium]